MNHTAHAHKTKVLAELEQLLGPAKGVVRTKLLHAAERKLNLLELEVVTLRMVDTGERPSPAYLEIAARLSALHANPAITEQVVRLAANTARQVLWNALSAQEQACPTTEATHLPKPVIKFILGLETD